VLDVVAEHQVVGHETIWRTTQEDGEKTETQRVTSKTNTIQRQSVSIRKWTPPSDVTACETCVRSVIEPSAVDASTASSVDTNLGSVGDMKNTSGMMSTLASSVSLP
jgi:hypothetical protein